MSASGVRLPVSLLLLAACCVGADRLRIPLGLDEFLPVAEGNPITPEKAALGRELFFDKRLSRDGSVACATCHDPAMAFTDARPVAIGLQGRKGNRRSPRILNRAYGKSFFWDGRARTLEEQVTQPIENPLEMDMKVPEVVERLRHDSRYSTMTETSLRNALAAYVRTILAGDSPYDRYVAGDRSALNTQEQLGLKLFRGKAGCTACHLGPNLTDERRHDTGIGAPGERFKTPSLREVARTPPYMHDGSLTTLNDVIEHYDKGGPGRSVDPEIRKLGLTAAEKSALVAFIQSLNGRIVEGWPR